MKLTSLACLLLAATTAFAQNNQPLPRDFKIVPPNGETFQYLPPGYIPPGALQPLEQTGCPIVFTDVALQPTGRSMLIKQDSDSPRGSLAFEYQNTSGKLIRSISVRVELKIKKSIYDLDSQTVVFNMTLIGNSAKETLPLSVIAYGLDRVTLQQIIYADGKAWMAPAKNTCSYQQPQGSLRVGTLQ